MQFVKGVTIEAPDVAVSPQEITTLPGTTINATDLFTSTGQRNWTIATIDWGNGATSLLEFANSQWNVIGGQASSTYSYFGTYYPRISLMSDTKVASGFATITVGNFQGFSPLKPIANNTTLQPLLPSDDQITISNLVDTNPRHIGGSHEGSVDWNLGPSQLVHFNANQNSQELELKGSADYLAPGSHFYKLAIKDQLDEMVWGGSIKVASPSLSNLEVLDFAPSSSGRREKVLVAKFKASDTFDPNRFRASIDWGDGSSSVGEVIALSATDKTYGVIGSHSYIFKGSYRLSVTVQDGGATGVSTTIVKNNLAVNAIGQAGQLTHIFVGNFEVISDRTYLSYGYDPETDPSYYPWPHDYGAFNSWYFGGDDTPYQHPLLSEYSGHYRLNTVRWFNQPTAQTDFTARIHGFDKLVGGAITVAQLNEGRKLPLVQMRAKTASSVTFMIAGSDALTFQGATATADWGDGTSSSVGLESASDGSFRIVGSHIYDNPGRYPITFQIKARDHQPTWVFKSEANVRFGVESLIPTQSSFAAQVGQTTGDLMLAKLPASGWSFPWPNASPEQREKFRVGHYFNAAVRWGNEIKTARLVVRPNNDIEIYGEHTFTTLGETSAIIRLETEDGVGIETAIRINVVQTGWSASSQVRTNGLGEGYAVSTGPAGDGNASVLVGTGDVTLTHPVDLDASPGSNVGGNPLLVYSSGTVNVKPIVESLLRNSDIGFEKPVGIDVRILWDTDLADPKLQKATSNPYKTSPVPTVWTSFQSSTVDNTLPAELWVAAKFGASDLPVAHSGIHSYQLQVRLRYANDSTTTAFSPQDTQATYRPDLYFATNGQADVVVRDNEPGDYLGNAFDEINPWGWGWTLSAYDRLVVQDNNDLLWVNAAGSRRWTMNANDRVTWDLFRATEQTSSDLYPKSKVFSGYFYGGPGIVTYEAEKPEFGTLTRI